MRIEGDLLSSRPRGTTRAGPNPQNEESAP